MSRYAGWLGSLGTEEADQRLARSLEASRLTSDEFVAAMAPSMFSPSADVELVAPFLDSVRAFHPSGFRAMALASYPDQRHVLAEVDVPRSCFTPTTTYVLRSRLASQFTAQCQGPNLS